MHKLYIPPVLMVYSGLLMLTCFFLFPQFNLIPIPYNFIGLGIAFYGFFQMGKAHKLFIQHQTTERIAKSSNLIQEGIFGKSRNPMYVSMFTLLLGLSIASTNLISIVLPFLFLLIVFILFVRKEEKMLEENFGQEYLKYKRKVSRWY